MCTSFIHISAPKFNLTLHVKVVRDLSQCYFLVLFTLNIVIYILTSFCAVSVSRTCYRISRSFVRQDVDMIVIYVKLTP